MTYIGDVTRLKEMLERLRNCKRFSRVKSELNSGDWEQFESAFAVAKECWRLLNRGVDKNALEFEPEVTVDGEKKYPDYRAKLTNRWIYFEVKASSMFPKEKNFLEMVEDVEKGLSGGASRLKYIVKIYSGEFSENQIGGLGDSITKRAEILENKTGVTFPQRYFYPSQSKPAAEYIFLGYIEPALYGGNSMVDSPFERGEEFIRMIAVNPKEGHTGNYTAVAPLFGPKLMFMDGDFDEFLGRLTSQLRGDVPGPMPEAFGLLLVNVFLFLSANDYLLIAESPPYRPKNRLRNILDKAWKQLPENNANIVVIYTREVILRMREVREALSDLFELKGYSKISCVVTEIELASGERQRKLFRNPNATVPIKKKEIGILTGLGA